MFQRRSLLGFLSVLALIFSGCGGGVDLRAHNSDEGLVLEAFLPFNVGMLASYSLRDEVQFSAVLKLEEKLTDEGKFSKTFSDQFDAQFEELGLDYERDLKPAFGTQLRFIYAARMLGSNTSMTEPETFSVVTLADKGRLADVFQVLVDAKQLEEKAVATGMIYVNNEKSFYAAIHEDLLLIASSAENLQNMLSQDEEASLWASSDYQDALVNVGSNEVFYAMMFPAHYVGEVKLSTLFSVGNIPSILEHQTLVVRAEDEGLRFEAYVNANKAKAKILDFSFDQVPHSKPYLAAEVPAQGLLGYFESYGLKQSLDAANKLDGGNEMLAVLEENVKNYLGMSLEDLTSFLDKAYAVGFHSNGEGIFPGVSVVFDVSSNPEKAKELVDKVDGQLSGLIAVFEAGMPGAFVKETVDMQGSILNRVKVDLSAVTRSQQTPLPASITQNPIEFIYGLKGDRLLLSTAAVWSEEKGTMVLDSELYKNLNALLQNVDEGLILLDAQELAAFAANLRALREQLDLQVSEEASFFEDFLQGFSGVIAKSKSNAYDSLFSGYFQLAQ